MQALLHQTSFTSYTDAETWLNECHTLVSDNEGLKCGDLETIARRAGWVIGQYPTSTVVLRALDVLDLIQYKGIALEGVVNLDGVFACMSYEFSWDVSVGMRCLEFLAATDVNFFNRVEELIGLWKFVSDPVEDEGRGALRLQEVIARTVSGEATLGDQLKEKLQVHTRRTLEVLKRGDYAAIRMGILRLVQFCLSMRPVTDGSKYAFDLGQQFLPLFWHLKINTLIKQEILSVLQNFVDNPEGLSHDTRSYFQWCKGKISTISTSPTVCTCADETIGRIVWKKIFKVMTLVCLLCSCCVSFYALLLHLPDGRHAT